MTDLDLDAITARAAIRPGALLTALRCVPDGEIRHGCVISDGTQTKDAIRAAYHVVHKDVPALVEEVRRLRNGIDRLRQATTELALYTAIDELAGIYRTGGDRTLPGEE